MHNLHFITINAISAKHACEKVDNQFNGEKEDLDFSKLNLDPQMFKELDSTFLDKYVEENYKSFVDYLTNLIDPTIQTNIWHLEDSLDRETFNKITHFLEAAGYDPHSEDNLFDVTVLGAFDKDDSDRYSYGNGRFDFSGYTKSGINQIMSEKTGEEIDCFGDITEIEGFSSLDEVGIRDYSDNSELPKFLVILDVKS